MLNDNCNETAGWKFDDETWRNLKPYWLQSHIEIQNSNQIGGKHFVLSKCQVNNQLKIVLFLLSQQTVLWQWPFTSVQKLFSVYNSEQITLRHFAHVSLRSKAQCRKVDPAGKQGPEGPSRIPADWQLSLKRKSRWPLESEELHRVPLLPCNLFPLMRRYHKLLQSIYYS